MGTAHTGRKSRQRSRARKSAQKFLKGGDTREMLSQPSFESAERRHFRYFLRLLGAHRGRIVLALLAMVLDSLLSVMRPWPLKVVIDRVLSHRPSRAPLIHAWLDSAPFTKMQILYGSCAAVLFIAFITGLTTYCYTRLLGNVGQRFVFDLRRGLFPPMQRLFLRFPHTPKTRELTTRMTPAHQTNHDLISKCVI